MKKYLYLRSLTRGLKMKRNEYLDRPRNNKDATTSYYY